MRHVRLVLLLVVAGACSDSALPTNPIPKLETLPYALLGTGKIAFERIASGYHAIYVVDPVAQTTSSFASYGAFTGPALSPDGQLLAVATYTVGTSLDIYVVKTTVSDQHTVSARPGDEGVPSWT